MMPEREPLFAEDDGFDDWFEWWDEGEEEEDGDEGCGDDC